MIDKITLEDSHILYTDSYSFIPVSLDVFRYFKETGILIEKDYISAYDNIDNAIHVTEKSYDFFIILISTLKEIKNKKFKKVDFVEGFIEEDDIFKKNNNDYVEYRCDFPIKNIKLLSYCTIGGVD